MRALPGIVTAGALVLALTGCVSIEVEPDVAPGAAESTDVSAASTEPVVEESSPATEDSVDPALIVARAEQSPEQVAAAQDLYSVMVATLDTGSATDEQLFAAGAQACDVFDAGGDMRLAGSFTVLELPTDLPDEAYLGTAYAAARSLCPEHESVAQVE